MTAARTRIGRLVLGGAALVCLGALIGWAVSAVLVAPRADAEGSSFTYVDVVDGDVGSSLNVNAVAQWDATIAGSNRATGTVTSIGLVPGGEAHPGDVLYTVDLRPVVVATGDVPMFRGLSTGARGHDVAQLQELLTQLGMYSGTADGNFGAATRAAVRTWQNSLGMEPTGVVLPADIVFIPSLPVRLTLDPEDISRGAVLAGGEKAILSLGVAPRMTVPVTATQASAVRIGATVRITGPDGERWLASVTDLRSEDDKIELVLEAAEGGAICGDRCDQIPVGTETLLPAEIVLVNPVHGSVVPTAALITRGDGSLVVVDRAGVDHPVTVLATAKGMSAVSGVSTGLAVRIANAGTT